jgi:hypothetical protein
MTSQSIKSWLHVGTSAVALILAIVLGFFQIRAAYRADQIQRRQDLMRAWSASLQQYVSQNSLDIYHLKQTTQP